METIRKAKFCRYISFVLCLLLSQGLYSCKRDANLSIDKEKLSNLSGEEIFKGIFFLKGDLPQSVKFLSKRLELLDEVKISKDVSSTKNQIMDEVIAEVKKSNPEYFSNLKKSLYDRDYNDLNENLQKGANLLYVGMVKSKTMKTVMPAYEKILDKLDMQSYDFQEKSDVNRFLKDVEGLQAAEGANSTEAVAAVVFVVAAAVVITVAVAVSWVGAVQVLAGALAWIKVKVVEETERSGSGVLNSFDSQLLTKDMINAI